MTNRVPFVDPREHYRRLKSEIDDAIISCLSQGDLIYRHQLKSFEENFARFVGAKYAVGVNSGYHALHFSLVALGIKPGDEVITVAHTFVATISAIVHCGAKPVLVDVQSDHNMDVAAFERAITPKTRAVIPVHLNGRMADMTAIMEIAAKHSIKVIEDAAQSLGARCDGASAGAIGETGCFSFYPFKVLGGFGDGGALTTSDAEVARKAALLRYNGEDRETGEYHYHGYTALLDNVQAAVLDRKLLHLPQWIDNRRRIAATYDRELLGVGDLTLPASSDQRFQDVFQNYVVRTTRRNALRQYLRDNGVETLIHWPKPVWEHVGLGLGPQNLPVTASLSNEVISLPMSAEISDEQALYVAKVIKSFFDKH